MQWATLLACMVLPVFLPHAPPAPSPLRRTPRAAALVTVHHGTFLLDGRALPPLHGINYEGPADRPWHMWQDGLFSPTLIDRDFSLIAAAGYSPVRIFVQRPLPELALRGDFARLDRVIGLASAHGLRLLITFNDDGDRDMRYVTQVERAIAAHLAGNPTVFGYDLRNEPALADIAGSRYPAGIALPLLSSTLRRAYAPTPSHGSAPAAGLPTTATPYAVAQTLLNRFLRANPDYPTVTPDRYWTPLLDLANRTLAAYLTIQSAAIRAVDPLHPVTVGYSSPLWAALPANTLLDFRSIHIYPPADAAGFQAALQRFEDLNALAPSPLLLEEYGVSNDLTGRQSAAVREMAVALYLRTFGGGGEMKWMFSDDAVGYNTYENNLGAVAVDGTPKPTYLASTAAVAYWNQTVYGGGLRVQPDPVSGVGFVFAARDALSVGGSLPYSDERVRYRPRGPGVLWLDWSQAGLLRLTATTAATVSIDLTALTGAGLPAGRAATTVTLQAGATRLLRYSVRAVPPLPIDLPTPPLPNGLYLLSRGHTVAAPFLAGWQALGGAAVLGLPLTERFAYTGLPTQYFDTVALRIGARGLTTAPLGVVALHNAVHPRASPFPATIPHFYDPVTGHNVHGFFLDYWRRTGGVRLWGHPLTEEMSEDGRLVQYFSGAEFTLAPTVGGHVDVALLPLGRRMWPSVRHVYGL